MTERHVFVVFPANSFPGLSSFRPMELRGREEETLETRLLEKTTKTCACQIHRLKSQNHLVIIGA